MTDPARGDPYRTPDPTQLTADTIRLKHEATLAQQELTAATEAAVHRLGDQPSPTLRQILDAIQFAAQTISKLLPFVPGLESDVKTQVTKWTDVTDTEIGRLFPKDP